MKAMTRWAPVERRHLFWLSFVALFALALAACTREEAAPSREPSGEGEAEGADTVDTAESAAPAAQPALGRIVGRVVLKEGAELPIRPRKRGDAENQVEGCPEIEEADYRPVFEGEDGLVNILVTLTGDRERFFKELPPRAPQEVELVIRANCRLQPRLLGAVVGDALLLKNRSERPMLPYVGVQSFVETLSSGETRRQILESRGVFPVGCGVTGFCGSADLVVLAHPVFDVTEASGRFEIENVPADQDITIHAWHPLFQEVKESVRVPRGETVEVELTIAPLERHTSPSEIRESTETGEGSPNESAQPTEPKKP